MRTVLDKARSEFGSFDLKAINGILSSTADNLLLDKGFGAKQLVDLAKSFKGFSGERIQSHALAVYCGHDQWGERRPSSRSTGRRGHPQHLPRASRRNRASLSGHALGVRGVIRSPGTVRQPVVTRLSGLGYRGRVLPG